MQSAPADTSGPFYVVLNAASGKDDAAATRAIIDQVLAQAGRAHEVALVTDSAQLAQAARRAVERAQGEGGVVVAAGGDGTINTVAQAALGSGRPFGVLPQGTFNYFGRTHGIPEDTEAATRLLLDGQPQPVQVGRLNERVFLVNASLGLYPTVLEDREAFKKHYGRSRLIAALAGLATVLGAGTRQIRIRVETEGQTREVRTPTLFVGNNRLQLEQLGMPQAPLPEQGALAAIMLRPVGTWELLGLLVRGALGQLGEAADVVSFGFREMTVRPFRPSPWTRVKVALDGEVLRLAAPLRFSVAQEHLLLIKPSPEPSPLSPITG